MSPGLERCPPAQPHGKGRGKAAKLMTANTAGQGPFLGVGGEAAPKWAPDVEGGSAPTAANTFTLCRGVLSFSSLGKGRDPQREGWRGSWGLRPPYPLPPLLQN